MRGVVRIGQTDEPFPNAQVRVTLANGKVIERTTDADGRWELSNLEPGKLGFLLARRDTMLPTKKRRL
jgi:uncharacterized protein YfaS (alpha-2-macroglobulin family)